MYNKTISFFPILGSITLSVSSLPSHTTIINTVILAAIGFLTGYVCKLILSGIKSLFRKLTTR